MHDAGFLGQIVILFGTAVLVAWVFRIAKAPSIIGYLCTGMVIGPHAWGFIESESVDQFAEIGLVLLLFTVGLELSAAPLLRSGRRILTAVLVQVGTIAIVAGLAVQIGGAVTGMAAALVGVAVSLSSTAIVLKQLSDSGELRTSVGNISTGVLLLQDVFVIGLMVALPFVVEMEGSRWTQGPLNLALAGGALVALVLVARKVLPVFVEQLIRHGGQELSALFAVAMACGGAWAAELAGWPPALGACVAGLLLANADIRDQLVAEITPFRDVFNALFFVSLGMLVNFDIFFDQWLLLTGLVLLTLVLKTLITAASIGIAGWPLRISLQAGLGLCTVSEFGYVLLRETAGAGLLEADFFDRMVVYTVGTMMFGAILFPFANRIAGGVSVYFDDDEGDSDELIASEHDLDGHAIIVGYGVNGENLVRVLQATSIPFCVIEMNRGLVQKAREVGAPVVVGDATRLSILNHAGLPRARALVVAMNDHVATRRVVSQARAQRADLYILARTYFTDEIETLSERGANLVVPADFEAAVKIFSHVLEEFDVPRNILGAQIAAIRAGGYGVFRGKSSSNVESLQDLLKVLQLTATQTFFLPETSEVCGKTIAETNLRRDTGATIIAVVRDRRPTTNPAPTFVLEASDVLVLVGSHEQLRQARKRLEASSQLGPA